MAPISRPKAQKPSKVVKPTRSRRRTTESHKNHRFQPFSERIAKLKIDPVRRRRDAQEVEDLSGATETHFGRSLEEWRDLNMSQTFTSFAKEAALLCESLPALIHSEGQMIDILVVYIEKGDGLAMEPLLSLLSHFAHDLDSRFEKHFQRAVSTVAAVAAKHPDPAVVEWSFTCLAWLFKYLSRLLVPDLRPLYDLMAPYLGEEAQKPFIIRFAAESVSFLVRKAASAYERDPKPLKLIIDHMLGQADAATDLQRQGIMTLLTEAMRGVQGGLHSGAIATLQCMLDFAATAKVKEDDAVTLMITGTLTSIIHHTNADTFRPVQDMIIRHLQANDGAASQSSSLTLNAHLIFTIASVRKGTRISDWKPLVSRLRRFVEVAQQSNDSNISASSLLGAVAVTLQLATIDAVLPNIAIVEELRGGIFAPFFMQFCDLFARLGNERFQQFLLPQFQKYIAEHWSNDGDAILSLLPALVSPLHDVRLACPEPFQQQIVDDIVGLRKPAGPNDSHNTKVAEANRALKALPRIKLGESSCDGLVSRLESLVRDALGDAKDCSTSIRDFALGTAMACLLDNLKDCTHLADLWPALCVKGADLLSLSGFWNNVARYLKVCAPKHLDETHVDTLESTLLQCLSMPSHEIRQAALDIIEKLYQLRERAVPAILSTAILIESTPISFETSRRISMDIRRLAQGYSDAELDSFMQKAVPSYCFGLLHIQLTQAWDDATNALAGISRTAQGEQIITSLVERWLDGSSSQGTEETTADPTPLLDVESNGFVVASDFECSNLARMSAICRQVFHSKGQGRPSLHQQVRLDNPRVPAISSTARSQALRVLNKIPQLAEKRSRMLVPILLRWAGPAIKDVEDGSQNHQRWNRADQKAMLAVLSQFQNPRVLYRQAEVYGALLNLCSNGDAEIQRSALMALCAWKEPSLTKYEGHLVNLLDESRFREELSVFLQGSMEDSDNEVQQEDLPKLMPVLLRLIYGRAVAGGKQGQGTRRKAIFVALSQHGDEVLGMFVDIALGPLAALGAAEQSELQDQMSTLAGVPLRRQLGMVNMFDDMLETLGPELKRFSRQILAAILVATVSASRRLSGAEEPEDASLLRAVRSAGMQCLVSLFSTMGDDDLLGHAQIALQEIVLPRLEKLASENTQSVSGLLRLISAWCSSPKLVHLVLQQQTLLTRVADLLQEPTAKDKVRAFILQDILDNLLDVDSGGHLQSGHVKAFSASIGKVLNQQPSKDVLDACVKTLTKLSTQIEDKAEAESILMVCADLLSKPFKIVSPTTKIGLLRTMMPLPENFDIGADLALYKALCGLFSRLRGQEDRSLLSSVFVKLCSHDAALLQSAKICADMNAAGAGLEEVDHERRERGFTKVYELSSALSTMQWQPVVHNCLYYIRDAEDMVNRTSASQALERFVTAATNDQTSRNMIADTVLPGIEHGMKESSELVRSEYLRLLGHIVTSFPEWPAVSDMTALSVGGDDEASMFANALHIQQHRRLRALRRLADEATTLSSSNTTKFFLPLLEHFVFDQVEGDAGRTLSDQTIQTLGALAKALTWSAFRATFKRYIGYLSSKEDHEKAVLRLLGTFVDALKSTNESAEKDIKKSEIVIRDFLPPLTDYVHHKDESTTDRRMPVAITIVKLLQTLPESEMSARLAPVLTDVTHVLRSRSQEARDQTRKTLATISSLVGTPYLGFIVKELRSALQRGYQLHVLSFTVHSLLVNAIEASQPGDLDYCIPELMSIIMDDIFGVTGQEKDAEEYKSGMKEVKSSKSFDTMELLARVVPVPKLGLFVRPLRDLLSEKLDSKMLKNIDDLLTRLRKGLDQNAAADSRDMLVFCHEIVRQVHAEQEASTNHSKKPADRRVNRYLIQMESANKSKARGATTSQLYKLASFALHLLRKVLRRHEDIMTPGNMAGFLPIAGDALVQGQEDVQVAAVKLLSTVMKLPMAELDTNAPVYTNEAVRLIKGSSSMTTDSAKAGLELITAVLREKRSVTIKDRDIGEVLKCIKADIDEPDRQGIIYKFLRAVLGRKIMIKEVYELMDEVGKVVVTNADRNVRESARSAYFQFVLEYPQGKDRWNKQAAFFVENLKYERPNGRQSVMELLHQLLIKIGADVFSQLAFTLFVALVPVLANGEDHSCRQMAGILIGKLVERANEEQCELFMKLMDKWMKNAGNQAIQIAAMQCWIVVLQTRAPEQERLESLRDGLAEAIRTDAEGAEQDPEDLSVPTAMKAVEALVNGCPEVAYGRVRDDAEVWKALPNFLTVLHDEAKELAAKLLGSFFSHIASSSSKTPHGLAALPLHGSFGIALEKSDLRHMCSRSLSALRNSSSQPNESTLNHNVRNLVFLGRCFAANGMAWKDEEEDDEASSASEAEHEDEELAPQRDPSALAYLLNRLSYIIRQERFPPTTRTAAIQAQAALLPHVPQLPNLDALIRPLYLLTDPSIPQPPGDKHRVLVDHARDLLEAIQKKVGSETYVSALGAARKDVGKKREERRQKRRIDAVSRPERWAKEKRRKVEGKKAKKREKGVEYRGKRRGW